MEEWKRPQFLSAFYDEQVAIRGFKGLDEYIYRAIVCPIGPELVRQVQQACRETEISGILTRGSMSRYLMDQHISVPIFDVKYDMPTIFRLLQGCIRDGYRNIGIFEIDRAALQEELPQATSCIHATLELSDCTVQYYKMRDHDRLRQTIGELAARKELDMVVGDSEPLFVAEELNIPARPFLIDQYPWLSTVNEALYFTEVARTQASQDNFIEVITNIISEAVIIVGRDGLVKRCNRKGQKLFSGEGEAHVVTELLPGGMDELLGQTANQLVTIRERKYIVNVVPLLVDGEEHYALILNNVSYVEGMEMSIRKQNKNRDRGLSAKLTFDNIVCEDETTKKLVKVAKKYARTNSTILICGETGTGKEVFASSIHNASTRADGPFVAINCATLSESLIESELFGYEKGAFTGALQSGKPGLFELAHKGSIFLDEIGELPLRIQAKLLRVLQEKEIMRLGGEKIIPVDVRVIAATNKDLREMVRQKLFREDLYYRLALLEIEIPPLRRRTGDIIPLFTSFLSETAEREHRSIYWNSTDIFAPLLNCRWSGNIRELRNLAERVVLLCEGNKLTGDAVVRLLRSDEAEEPQESRYSCEITGDLKRFEREYIEFLLGRFGGDRDSLCRYLHLSKTTLWRKLPHGGEEEAEL